ncbi:hypothetical protein VQ7734_03831 [Vibrio quintilis]|uniref:Uncharacterized protein n=2 Tax=Vibrio quintilis TaxID=1117707 RepID=A0A1M7YZJ5_9VIBR|nr:hypothetical protein VQ7734_03831 [Vibrio quintilis]
MYIEDKFGFNFEFKLITQPDESDSDFYCFPGCMRGGWVDGIAIDFDQFGWCGSFARGKVSKNGINGIYSFPGKDKVLIVSKGKGYLVSPEKPESTIELKMQPIMGVYCNTFLEIIIVNDFTHFIAFNKEVQVWKSKRISYDGIRDIEMSDEFINGEAWSSPENKWLPFKLSLDSGVCIGGAFDD